MLKLSKLLSLSLMFALLTSLSLSVFAAPPKSTLNQDNVCSEDYVVQANDWLSKLADKYYGDVLAYPMIFEATNTAAANDDTYATIENADIIEIGWTLCIPAAEDGMMMDDKAMDDTAMMDDTKAMTDTAMMDDTKAMTDTVMMEEDDEAMAMTPAVTVADQAVVDGSVTIAKVVSSGPGWLVVHAQADGGPGPVLGQTAVADGENADVVVALNEEGLTDVLYAMLHTDAGTIGTYEFPGDDGPVAVDGEVVTPAFNITHDEAMMEKEEEAMAMTPAVTVADQAVVDGSVTIEKVISSGPGWLVVHAQADGGPGPVLGQTAVADGENADVVVALNEEGLTDVLYAMLHTDAGTIGTYEFPGDDGPVAVDGEVVTPAFNVTQ